jgi:hypothetical protein
MPTEETATKLIPPLPSNSGYVQYIKELLLKKLKRKPEPNARYQGANVHMFGDNQNGYVVLEKNGEILYLVRHELVKHNALQLGRQVLVWRNRETHSAAARGFASHVFFDFLLPKYKALIADKEQTADGKQFWEYALGRAFELEKHVYYLNRRATPNTLLELEDYADVLAHEDELWGHDQGHLRTFAVISQVPLKIKGSGK